MCSIAREIIAALQSVRGSQPPEGVVLDNFLARWELLVEMEPLKDLIPLPQRMMRVNEIITSLNNSGQLLLMLKEMGELVYNRRFVGKDTVLHVNETCTFECRRFFCD